MAAAPPPPSREHRKTLSVHPVIDHSHAEHDQHQEVPTDVENGVELTDQTAAPDHYRWFKAVITGNPEDMVELHISRTVQAGAANIFVALPGSHDFPTKEIFDWSAGQGNLYGPVGEYKISVYAVPSFIEKDELWLVDPNTNWATFSLYVEWNYLEPEKIAALKKVREQYTREKPASIWSSSHSQELLSQYRLVFEDQKKQQEELEKKASERQDVSLEGNEVLKHYDVGSQIGIGDFAVVKKGTHKATKAQFALKIIDLVDYQSSTGYAKNKLLEQADIMKSISHPNIEKLKESFHSDLALVLVTDIFDGEDIAVKLAAHSEKPLTEQNVRGWISKVVDAVSYLHTNNIIHRSLMPSNVLLASNETDLKLVGSSFAKINNSREDSASGVEPFFEPPEVIRREGYGKEVDIWQIGILTYILISGVAPFSDKNTIRLFAKISEGKFTFPDSEWKSVSASLKSFIQETINVDFAKRPTIQQLSSHAWLKQTDAGASLPTTRKTLSKYYS